MRKFYLPLLIGIGGIVWLRSIDNHEICQRDGIFVSISFLSLCNSAVSPPTMLAVEDGYGMAMRIQSCALAWIEFVGSMLYVQLH